VPQNILSQVELLLLVAVKEQLISAGSSKPVIGLVQDGLIGVYNITDPDVKIDYKTCMNLLTSTSFKDFKNFEKKDYSGSELLSLILPFLSYNLTFISVDVSESGIL
jgi:DNA-directed RNA polymerase beta' subunit